MFMSYWYIKPLLNINKYNIIYKYNKDFLYDFIQSKTVGSFCGHYLTR